MGMITAKLEFSVNTGNLSSSVEQHPEVNLARCQRSFWPCKVPLYMLECNLEGQLGYLLSKNTPRYPSIDRSFLRIRNSSKFLVREIRQ
jgi:hypothetical protein